MEYKIFSHIDTLIEAYGEPVQRVPGLTRRAKDVIRTVEFYSNDQYLTGNKDELGREKPFYNVSNYRVTVAKTATDLDVKDIRYEPDSLKFSTQAMLINKELFKYLKESNFSQTLNDMGDTRPRYGGVLVKKYEGRGKLDIEVLDWVNVDFNPNHVQNGVIVETHWMQPSEFASRSDVWEVEEALKAHARANKGKPCAVEVKEVHGDFPLSFYPDEEQTAENDSKYGRMCFYIAVVGEKKYMLHYEMERENPFKYLAWRKMGDGLGKGVVEDGFESQWAINDAIISTRNVMNLAGKVILSTNSKKVSGNAITDMQNGHILEIEPNATIQSLNLMPSALPQFQNVIELWNQQYDKVASTFAANTGEAPTAGTPYAQTALLNQVANSPFEYQREVWGIWLNEILNDWVLPFLKRRIRKAHNLTAEYTDEELDLIDEAVAAYEGRRKVVESLLRPIEEGNVTPEEDMMNRQAVKNGYRSKGKKREIEIPEGFLDVEGHITANITGELKNKAAMLASVDNIISKIMSTYNPNTGTFAAFEDKTLLKLFGIITDMAGVPFSAGQLRPSGTAPVAQPDMSAIAAPVAA